MYIVDLFALPLPSYLVDDTSLNTQVGSESKGSIHCVCHCSKSNSHTRESRAQCKFFLSHIYTSCNWQIILKHIMSVFSLPLTSLLHQSSDRTACIWDSRSGQCVMRFEGHEGEVNSVRFFPTGEAIGTACNDGTVSSVHM